MGRWVGGDLGGFLLGKGGVRERGVELVLWGFTGGKRGS